MTSGGRRKIRVLFVCVHNSFRSQIAEAILNHKYGDRFIAESAGIQEKGVTPLAILAMEEYGLDISGVRSNSVFDFCEEGRHYDYVIAVCSKEAQERCPVFPGSARRLHWGLDDPELFEGSPDELLDQAIVLRNQIEEKVDRFALETAGAS